MGLFLPHRRPLLLYERPGHLTSRCPKSVFDAPRRRDLRRRSVALRLFVKRNPKPTVPRLAPVNLLTIKIRPRLSWPLLLLPVILAAALALRLHGLDWDEGYGFHPDERSIYMRAGCIYDLLTERPGYQHCLQEHPEIVPGLPSIGVFLDFDRSPLNPHWFPLGSVLLYILVLFRSVIELFTDLNALDLRYVGRILSALADTGSVWLLYVLGRRIYGARYGPWVGLLAAGLTALAVIHIQNSHYYRPETLSILLLLASCWAMLRVVERRRLRDSLLLGLLIGLAMTPKLNVFLIVLPLLLTYGWRLVDSADGVRRAAWKETAGHALAAGGIALAAFFALTPYALLDLPNFISEQAAQANMARNAGLWPFTIQYIGTPPFLYQFHQTAVWGLGLPLGLAAWGGIVFTAIMAYRGGRFCRGDWLLLAWVVPGILFLESFEVRFQRYFFPLLPFMVLMGARMLLWLPAAWRDRPALPAIPVAVRRWLPVLAWTPVVLVIAATALYSLAFQRIYANPHPAIAAAQWLNKNLPPGTPIISDNHWDEFIPELYQYQVWQFPAYEPDNAAKMAILARELASSDYLVFYSHRPYVSIASDPERFPYSLNYYQHLFGGGLGYRLERSFTSYPQLAGIALVDDPIGRAGLPRPVSLSPEPAPPLALNLGYADDNVVGYDHPRVMLFRNVASLTENELLPLLLQKGKDTQASLMLSEWERERQQSGGTWSQIFDRNSWVNRMPVLAWLLSIELIYLLTLPLALFLFRPLPDRGLLLARPLGLLLVSYLVWLAVSLGWLDFSRAAVVLGLAVVAALSALALAARWREMRDFLAQRWRLLVTGETLFLLAFLAFALLRAWNPDLWHPWRGGEKPMELAQLNAIIRSTLLPPYDPWFAGGYLNYYYWGHFILAVPIRLTGIIPTVAFNLAVPLLFALTVTGAYSIGYNLVGGTKRARRRAGDAANAAVAETVPTPGRAARLFHSSTAAGLLSALLVAVIGNLDGMVQVVQGAWERLAGSGGGFPPFDFWRSSRMIPNLESIEPGLLTFWLPEKIPGYPDISWHITEFPFFTFLFADLHAHLVALPFTLLVIAMGLNLLVGWRKQGRLWQAAAAAILALAIGALWPINSWDYPSYLLFSGGLAVVAAGSMPISGRAKLLWAIGLAGGIAAISFIAFLPYHQAIETFDAGIAAAKWQTPFDRYLAIHALFLFIAVTFLVKQTWQPLTRLFRPSTQAAAAPSVPGLNRILLRWYLASGLLPVLYLAAAGYGTGAILLALLLLTGLAVWNLLAADRDDGERPYALFPLLLLALALALGVAVELARLTGDIGRMNTLFKYYLEAWVLFGLAAAYFLWRLGQDGGLSWVKQTWAGKIWTGWLLLLVVSGLAYTVLAPPARLDDRFNPLPPTLDGMAYMERAVHWEQDTPLELKWDAAAIRWLQDNAAGSPAILEAHTEQYHWGGRIATYTGLPAVLGWPWHQIQQRGSYEVVQTRAAAVREMYETADPERAAALLRQYGVKYVMVGQLERVYYSGEGLAKFDRMVADGLARVAYANPGVTLYEMLLN